VETLSSVEKEKRGVLSTAIGDPDLSDVKLTVTALKGDVLHLLRHPSPLARQAMFLFGVDLVSNVVDYGFHAYLGRALLPGDFAVFQTVNSTLLIAIATLSMMQPVVARYVAEAEAREAAHSDHSRGIFRLFFQRSVILGLLLMGAVWLLKNPLAQWINVPALAVGLSSMVLLLTLLRSVIGGMLQGQQRFVAFGLTRSAYAIGRFFVGALLIGWGGGVLGAVAALPIGALLAVLCGLSFLGLVVWRPADAIPRQLWRKGLRLSAGAFVASAAYMSLLSSDLIWVNRRFAAEVAGSYATLVLLRRVLVLLPGAIVVVMYPRAVGQVTRGNVPDRLLRQTIAVVVVSILLPTLAYFALGDTIVAFTFGSGYPEAGPLLGWMGLAMLGYGVASIWYNLYLATRPAPYVLLLVVTAVMQILLLSQFDATLMQVWSVFMLGGWTLALGGYALYRFWLRPRLVKQMDA
jgi:O-antigen/teichoic acid export membrane protein